ncbi:AraC family transcriptional regulator [Maribacter polysaccharolyticus]|uniref:AraC family transcriptional regulator n=1 Tax=Maribacter polysaccharolyticus TaxID=3020831 RepID=UPI00237EF981|nr:AraC family transcriptional regulator [Maribacter polysaccharolyticus]MDE3740516.1 AraC family transcriptional regulator [Maribacter polysaccharolyticus]
MKVFNDINTYFINGLEKANDYSNGFFIREISKHKTLVKPGKEFFGPHKRDFFEIAVLRRNTRNIKIGNQTLQHMENSLAIVSPFQVINYSDFPNNNDNNDDEGFIIYFNPSIFTNLNQSYGLQNEFPFFKIHTMPIYHLNDRDFNDILNVAKELHHESRSTKAYNFEIVRSLLLMLLYKVKRYTQDNKGIVTMNRFEAVMSKFEQELLSSNNQFLTVKEYASKLHISPIYLTECTKKATGKSAQKIIIDYKILYAKTLLHQMGKSIAEVAYALNFNEVANFNQFFKRNTGVTATQFRNGME